MSDPIRCEDLKNEPGFPGCCDSHHDDIDEGIEDELFQRTYKGVNYYVCCWVDDWLKELHK